MKKSRFIDSQLASTQVVHASPGSMLGAVISVSERPMSTLCRH